MTASTMNFGDGEFGRGVIPTLEITFKGPNDYEMKVVTADAKSFMNRGNFYDAQTNQSRKDIVTEVIEAYALDSDSSLPNKLILKHDGTGKILALDYFKAQAYMDGKGPSYSGNFLRCNEK